MIFRKLNDNAKEPVRSTEHSAGLDLFALKDTVVGIGDVELVSTGIAFDLDSDDTADWYLDLRVRSSMCLEGIMLANGAGVVDKDYAGKEIFVPLYNTTEEPYFIPAGKKIAQMIVLPHMTYKAKGCIYKYDKRSGGFGSTGVA